MTTYIRFIFLFLIGMILMPELRAKESMPRLETEISSDVTVIGGKILYEVILWTDNPDIGQIALLSEPEAQDLTAERIRADRYFEETDKKGEKFYRLVIDRFFVHPEKNGKFKIRGGKYRIGINRKVVHNDPFWGPMYFNEPEYLDLEAPLTSLTIKPLPEKNKPSDFSGAVGDFKIEVEIPSGDIYENEEGLAIVRIYGTGFIPEDSFPELKKGFAGDIELHSFTSDINNYFDNNRPITELNIECYFKPKKSGEINIGEISFVYYDPKADKYKKIKSSEFPLNVKSRTSKNNSGSNFDI